MINPLKKITIRAKQIRKKQPGKSWKTAVKQAGAEYRKENRNRQTGKSSRLYDEMRKAKPPGKRKSESGRVYYERRKNRSDVPGTLTGINTLKAALISRLKTKLSKQLLRREMATTKRDRKRVSKEIADTKRQLRTYNQ